jgi:hypothetical protein
MDEIEENRELRKLVIELRKQINSNMEHIETLKDKLKGYRHNG